MGARYPEGEEATGEGEEEAMNKITEALKQNLEMTAIDVARIEVRKVPDPIVRAGIESLVDLLDHLMHHGERAAGSPGHPPQPEQQPIPPAQDTALHAANAVEQLKARGLGPFAAPAPTGSPLAEEERTG